ncbi:hypothetical protein PV08_09807 [Exophiala spinifera]|uniref:Phosphoglycerate mutase n=1 Tax=Exophiala spinifera TaxID=91928 RepID=A0A0D2B1P1_9EURO|nr:uncharacterized protein PV08_09807 [Exophiala spinifera]KIW12530.1 hypothetical protein PV08_09807 [Exophiala spinifera]
MGKQPAVIIITRHGARLDQADRNWASTAEKPFDTPLSYGGWIQSQTLGVRINNELHNLDTQSAEYREDATQDRPHKRRKIIIHSSPYLRCVQTAIAIGAGIQHPQNHIRPRLRPRQRSSRASLLAEEEAAPDSHEADSSSLQRTTSREPVHTNRLGYNTCRLRIDSFLGEWQSRTYFESALPPPTAVMVSEAKMALQVPQEEIKGADFSASLTYDLPAVDWEEKESEATSVPVQEKTGLRAMAAAGHSFPKRSRNISFGTELANGARLLNRNFQKHPAGYSAPVPTYAMGSSDKIPPGYVAHARDGCVTIDHDWDSEAEPLQWGDGGPFDEEWGNMHRRFRNGLQKMIEHYEKEAAEQDDEGKEDEDLVLVLVTHQAGCNALIRILTGAPALHAVATASLTMAVRTPRQEDEGSSMSPSRRRGSLDLSIADEYEMKIIASTEHLRAGSNPLGLNSPRLGKSPAFASRRAVGADSPEGFSLGESLTHHRGSHGALVTRSQSQRSHAADPASTEEQPSTGLWQKGTIYTRDEVADSSETGGSLSVQTGSTSSSIREEPTWQADRLPVRSSSQRGLWGGESTHRDKSPGKRSWTAVERSP